MKHIRKRRTRHRKKSCKRRTMRRVYKMRGG